MRLRICWLRFKEFFSSPRRLCIQGSEDFPSQLPRKDLVLLRVDGDAWSVGMTCPCGCMAAIELPLIAEVTPRWRLEVGPDGAPTLIPSVWLKEGCRSHFYLRGGKVIWI